MDTEVRAQVKLSSGESRGDKVTQVDTGNHSIDSASCCFVLISTILDLDLNCNGFGKLSQQPVWTVAPRRAGLDWYAVDVKREAPP